jgi:hypothetical protein
MIQKSLKIPNSVYEQLDNLARVDFEGNISGAIIHILRTYFNNIKKEDK